MADLLFRMIDAELEDHITGSDPVPKKGFADDLLLQLLLLLYAKRALQACGRWERKTGQTFTVALGKSASLRRDRDPPDLGLRVNGKAILAADKFEYLGVTLTATGPTEDSLARRVQAASVAMTNLRQLDILVRGMDIKHACYMYETFIATRWTYAAFLQPLYAHTTGRLDAVDAGFISSVLLACRVRGKGRRRSTLPVLRALLRLPSPALRRQILAHRYVARFLRITADNAVPQGIRARAQAAKQALPQVPGLQALVPDLAHPWDLIQIRAARNDEWHRATRYARRKVPWHWTAVPTSQQFFYPPALHFQEQWARALAARYHCNTFPILQRVIPRQGPRNKNARKVQPLTEQAHLSAQETAAIDVLPLLHRPQCSPPQIAQILAALRTLRPRAKWSREFACR